MTKHVIATGLVAGAAALAFPRALQHSARVRAEVNDPGKILADLQKTFADFQAGLDEQIKAKVDPLVTAQVDKMNVTIGELQAAIDKMNLESAARALNGNRKDERTITAEQRKHSELFAKWIIGGDVSKEEVQAAAKAAYNADVRKAYGPNASLSVGSDPDGGYLVPFELDPTVDRIASVQGGLAAIANSRIIKGDRYKKLISQGGATSGWVGEGESRASTSTPRLSEIEIVPGEVYVNAPATQQVLDDGDVEGWLREEVMIQFDEAENAAFVTGDGIKKPRGLMDYTIVANASYAWGSVGYIATGGASDFAATTPDNALQDMISALKQKYRPNARWIGNRGTVGKVRKFKDTTGQPLWQPSLQLGQPATLLGYPVTEDDNFADVGSNSYPLAFGDFKQAYTIPRKAGLTVDLRDPYTNKPYVMFYMVRRVGGGITNFEAFKVLKVATS